MADNKWAAGCTKAWQDDTGRKWRLKDEKFQVTRDTDGTQFRFCGYTLEELLSDAAEEPESFPGFREVPCDPYEDADVDRLVELRWSQLVIPWMSLDDSQRAAATKRFDGEARAFLTDYAAFKAKK